MEVDGTQCDTQEFTNKNILRHLLGTYKNNKTPQICQDCLKHINEVDKLSELICRWIISEIAIYEFKNQFKPDNNTTTTFCFNLCNGI